MIGVVNSTTAVHFDFTSEPLKNSGQNLSCAGSGTKNGAHPSAIFEAAE
jgi:hypothetical protein